MLQRQYRHDVDGIEQFRVKLPVTLRHDCQMHVAAFEASRQADAIIQPSRLATPDRAAETNVATEEWPMCTTMGSLASADGPDLDPDFAAGKQAMSKGQWAPRSSR